MSFLRSLILLFNITGRHVDITDAVRAHAQEKASKLPRFYNSINQVEVLIDGNDGPNVSVEVIARAEHSNVFVVTERGTDVYTCIDLAIHKLERQLRRKKERQRDNKHTGPGQ
jgi:putative sigma-54 modulation protein